MDALAKRCVMAIDMLVPRKSYDVVFRQFPIIWSSWSAHLQAMNSNEIMSPHTYIGGEWTRTPSVVVGFICIFGLNAIVGILLIRTFAQGWYRTKQLAMEGDCLHKCFSNESSRTLYDMHWYSRLLESDKSDNTAVSRQRKKSSSVKDAMTCASGVLY